MKLINRIRKEKELEQAVIRVIGGLLVVIYMLTVNATTLDQNSEPGNITLLNEIRLSVTYFLVMASLFLILTLRLVKPVIIRMVSLVFEISIMSLAMSIIAETMSPLFWLYYWIITGHAFRFGKNDLILATCLSFFGFLTAALVTPYWHEHVIATVSLLLSLIFIPFYIGMFAIRDINKQAELEEEKSRANAASEEKSNFLANVTHELRTPLNGVTTVGDLLERTELDAKQREYVDVITTSSKVLLSLINNILDYSKIESGIIEIENISFSVPELVMKTVSILKPVALEKGINFETRIADSIPRYTYGDPTKISQILMNLANNAIKFTNYGYTVVNVFPISSDDKTITIRFEVIDTGVGISNKAKSRIFDRFVQEDESVTRKFGGTGLGTAISKKLAEHMAGRIGLSSEQGVGSRFWFEIPLKITEAVHPVLTEQNVIVLSKNQEYASKLKQTIEVWDYTVEIHPDSNALKNLVNPGVERVPAAIIVDYAIADQVNDFIASLAENVTKNINFILLGPSKFSDKRVLELYDTILPTPIDSRELYQTLHFKSLASDSVVTPIRAAKAYKKKLVKTLKSLNILVCDDEPTNRFVMKEILESMDHNVSMAEDGYQALDMLQKSEFDLAILDLQMPEISGLEVAEMYHYTEPEKHVPMIMASANVRSEIIEKSRAYFDGFIEKPIDFQKLSALITRIIEEREKNASNLRFDLSRAMQTILFDTHVLKMYPKQALEKGFLTSLFETFIENANRKIADIKYSIERQDIESFKSHTHAIKGIAGNVKAKRLVELAAMCEELDNEAFSDTNTTDYILDNLRNCLNDTKIVLFEYLKEENRKKG